MPVLHSAVIRVASLEILCEHTAPNAPANYSDLTLKVLKRIPAESGSGGDLDGKKKTFIVQGVTYNFTGLRDLAFVCVADEASGRILPFSFLNEVLDSHQKQFRGDDSGSAALRDYSSFRVLLSQKMGKYSTIGSVDDAAGVSSNSRSSSSSASAIGLNGAASSNGDARDQLIGGRANAGDKQPQETSDPQLQKVRNLQKGLDEVKDVMAMNIEKVMQRGEAIDQLVDRTDTLALSSERFKTSSRRLRSTLCWQDFKVKAIIIVSVLLVMYLILASQCGLAFNSC